MKKIIPSKRLKFALIAAICNFVLFALGLYMGVDLISLGTGLSLINTPIYAYIFGETVRKSEK
jgi:drug/metabolite transporter (DMT)-like permease